MTSGPYASDAKIAAALAATGFPAVPQTTQQLWQAIATAFAARSGVSVSTALGGASLAPNEQTLLQQNFVLAATT